MRCCLETYGECLLKDLFKLSLGSSYALFVGLNTTYNHQIVE